MKKILSAWIEQILQFDSESEHMEYINDLEQKKQKFLVVEQEQDSSGKVTLHIKKQYNNNVFPSN
jgi:di/tripeptidase